MSMGIKCCKDCADRYRITDTPFVEDCHDHCERYQKERKALDEINKARANEMLSNHRGHKTSKNKNKIYHSKLGIYEKRSVMNEHSKRDMSGDQ